MDKGEASGDKNVEQKYVVPEVDTSEEINNYKIQAAGKNAPVFIEVSSSGNRI